MEQGVDGILMNTGIAAAQDPVRMAVAMKAAVESGRNAYLAGRMPKREVAVPSSPTTGMIASGTRPALPGVEPPHEGPRRRFRAFGFAGDFSAGLSPARRRPP